MKTITHAVVGIGAPILGYITSKQELVENLRVASLVIGCLVGILTAISLLLTIYWKLRNNKNKKG